MYKVTKGLPTKIFANTFKSRNEPNYKLCHIICSKITTVNSIYIGTESITFLRPKLWEPVPKEVKQKQSLNAFKDAIKNGHQQFFHSKIFYMVNLWIYEYVESWKYSLIYSKLTILLPEWCLISIPLRLCRQR